MDGRNREGGGRRKESGLKRTKKEEEEEGPLPGRDIRHLRTPTILKIRNLVVNLAQQGLRISCPRVRRNRRGKEAHD